VYEAAEAFDKVLRKHPHDVERSIRKSTSDTASGENVRD
jgi:hypothetical protein